MQGTTGTPEIGKKLRDAIKPDGGGDSSDMAAFMSALNKTQAIIEFTVDGNVIQANDNFLGAMGYRLEEIKGRHHSMFCDSAYTATPEYRQFWSKLNAGEFDAGQYRRLGKGGKEVWIQAAYNPVFDQTGKVAKVVKVASDITKEKLEVLKKENFSAQMFSMVENSPVNIMFADVELKLLYLNPKSRETLKPLAHLLPKPVEQLIGESIDIFHKNPAHQRRILASDKNLPHRAIITLGPEKLDLLVSPIYDANKKYIGAMVTWEVVTKKLEIEMNLARIQSMMENAPVNVMLADLDFKLIYMNPKSRDTLRSLEKHLPRPVDQLLGQSIDIFHKNPEHQRKMLADDRKLPIKTKIKVGDEILDLLVSPIYDANKKYLGPMVTWEVVTGRVALVKTLEETATQLAAAAEELSATAMQLSKNAQVTSDQSNAAAANTEEVSKGVQTVATNTEEMVASIKEIARNSSEAANISKDTMKKAQGTNQTITQLGASSQEIGNVIKVISSIAQQTNLLALNATIEAARAGDAGKGFAVVANEVKELAKQTAKATEDITNRIGSIQKDTQGAVDAIGGIAQFIEKLNGISMAIAAAIEEQTATTNEVARVVKESNKGVEGIAEVVKSVSEAARQSSSGAAQSLDAAKSLSQLAEKLKTLVKSIQV